MPAAPPNPMKWGGVIMEMKRVRETERLWETEPERAKGSPSARARSEGSQAVVEAGGFTWRADLPPALGGTNEAPSPTALLLGALAGCAVVFIRDTLAPQLGIEVEAVEATAQCDTDARGLLGMPGSRPDLQDLRLTIEVRSSASEEKLKQLFAVWQERCPVFLAIEKANPIVIDTRIVSPSA
jgi:uncharacterized OsmC-like protein